MLLVSLLRKQKGLGIVEIMVGLLLSSLLVAGTIRIFSSNQKAYLVQNQMSRLQEGSRFAFHFLVEDLRMAGYFGCSRNVSIKNNLNDTTSLIYDFNSDPIAAYRATGTSWSPSLPTAIATLNPLPGSDIVLVRKADDTSVDLRPPYTDKNNPASTLVVPGNDFQKGDIVMISDCTNATVVQITGTSGGGTADAITHNAGAGTPGNSTKDLGHNYGAGSTVARITTTIYYLADGANGPALFRKKGSANREELVDGVEEMRFDYGLDTNSDGELDQYVAAPTVTQRQQILAVRISLLMRGDRTNVVDGQQRFVFDGASVTKSDGRLRYVMSTTATLRNRAP